MRTLLVLFVLFLVHFTVAQNTEISDDFNRIDSLSYPSLNWWFIHYLSYSKMKTDGDNAYPAKLGSSCHGIWITDSFGDNQKAKIYLNSAKTGDMVSICLYSDSLFTRGYRMRIKFADEIDTVMITRTTTTVVSVAVQVNPTDPLEFYGYSDTLYCKVNNIVVLKRRETTYRGGLCGLGAYYTTGDAPTIDRFEAGVYYPPEACDSVEQVGFTDSTATTAIYKAVAMCEEATDTILTLLSTDTTDHIDTIRHLNVTYADTVRDTFTGLTPSTKYWCKSIDSTSISVWDTIWTADSVDTIIIDTTPQITITTQPRDTAIVNSGLVNFSVAATGQEVIHYRWIINGSAYGSDQNSVSFTADTSHDSSLIYCKLWSVGGDTVISDTALLRVWTAMVIDSVGIYRGVLFKGFFPYTIDSAKIDGMDGTGLIQTSDSIFEFTPPFALMWQREAFVVNLYSNGIAQSVDLYFDKNRKSTGNNKPRISIDIGL